MEKRPKSMPRIDNKEHRDMRRRENMKTVKPTPRKVLKKYKRGKLGRFLQIEGWREHPPRMGFPNWNDRNGRVIQGRFIWDFRDPDIPLRIMIPEGAKKEEVLILLKKMIRRLRSGWWEELWNDLRVTAPRTGADEPVGVSMRKRG